MNKRILTACLTATLSLSVLSVPSGISVVIDGDPVVFGEVGPMRVHGRVLVPLRGVLEKMGATVDYDAASQTVSAEKGDRKIELKIGEAFGRINDRDTPLDVPGKIFKGTTLVPLRFMGAALGARVDWDEMKSSVMITTSGG